MAEKLYKVGELVYCLKSIFSHIKDTEGYGIITDIVDINTGESYYEKNIVTGCGDRNTKVSIVADIIGKNKCNYDGAHWDISNKIEILDKKISGKYSTNCIVKLKYDRFENQYFEKLQNMNDNLALFKKYSLNRNDKLEIILSE